MHTQLSAPLVSVAVDESGCTTSSKRTSCVTTDMHHLTTSPAVKIEMPGRWPLYYWRRVLQTVAASQAASNRCTAWHRIMRAQHRRWLHQARPCSNSLRTNQMSLLKGRKPHPFVDS
jgi:hypothetical protein